MNASPEKDLLTFTLEHQCWCEESKPKTCLLCHARYEIERLRAIVADADHIICYLIGNDSPDEYMGVSEILKRMRREDENSNGEFEDDE